MNWQQVRSGLLHMSKNNRKWFVNGFLFVAIMFGTFWFILRGQDWSVLCDSLLRIAPQCLAGAALLSVFYICAEGMMIWYLLWGMNGCVCLGRCIVYSFIGFFFSGITPSASGGQPIQLYYMKKDGNALSESTVVLMTVALIYKLVFAVGGSLLWVFGAGWLQKYLQGYVPLFGLGLSLNIILVVVLLLVMLVPDIMLNIACYFAKNSETQEKIRKFIRSYQHAVTFLKGNQKKIIIVCIGTLVQRSSLCLLTYVVYRGMGLSEFSLLSVVLLQAAVYIGVDMLPIPGAQGITEAMYQTAFAAVFPSGCLAASMCAVRGISFYLLMIISGVIVVRTLFLGKD